MVRRVVLPVPIHAMPCVFRPEQHEPPIDPSALFRHADVEIEIGCGKGLFLAVASGLNPGTGYFGLERAEKYFRRTALRLHRLERANVLVAQLDAFDALQRWFPAGSLAGVHVYFPDPWPKSRHARRRLLQPALYPLVARCLREGGLFRIASDVASYFASAVEAIEATGSFQRIPWPEDAPDRLATNFSMKYAQEGRDLHYARFLRNGPV